MSEFAIFEVVTLKGVLYLRKEFVKQNYIKFPTGKMYECFTNEECEFYYNYVAFKNKNKYLEYGGLEIEDNDVITTEPMSIRTLSLEEFKNILLASKLDGRDLKQGAQDIINDGVSKEEADSQIRTQMDYINEEIELKKQTRELDTFNKVFGDLFEDNIPTR